MRRFLFPAVVVVFLSANVRGADHSQLMGVWRIDPAASSPVEAKAVKSGTLTIEYHHKLIHVAESTTFENGNRSVEMECDVDGHEHPLSGTAHYIRAKWEGSTLVATGAIDGGQGSIQLSLSPDGSTLTEIVRHTDRGGEFDRTLVWKRP